ncbi:MAG: DUF1858 domain-containing protein [Eubacteriales bacterium]|nr:DUF1858 domain-containing protein [Eubacteriales bacterium]
MEGKPLQLSESVYTLCVRYPELKELLARLGFTEIVKPGMLNTLGRLMTLPKGAALRKLDLEEVMTALRAHGFNPIE